MEHKDLSSCSQEPATGPNPKPDASSPVSPHYFSKIHSNITFPSTPTSSEWTSSLVFFRPNFCTHFSHLSHTCYMPARLILVITLR